MSSLRSSLRVRPSKKLPINNEVTTLSLSPKKERSNNVLPYLPEELWILIGKYLDQKDLFRFALLYPYKVGNRRDTGTVFIYNLVRISRNPLLWRPKITLNSVPLDRAGLKKLIPFLSRFTTTLHINGVLLSKNEVANKKISFAGLPSASRAKKLLSESFLRSLKLRCPKIKDLTLEGFIIDASQIQFIGKVLPTTLTHLSLIGSKFFNLPTIRTKLNSPLHKLNKDIPKLTNLDLRKCENWICDEDIVTLIQYNNSLTLNMIRISDTDHWERVPVHKVYADPNRFDQNYHSLFKLFKKPTETAVIEEIA